ncbi:DNA methyltransferase [Sodaliphilus pleomorphus]|uniref:site-specific DNA-methyltransferase (adenine-specific) n=1 Tax=Sodaliphilus pleomorphus TaxID=2606626 RepID=A0A6L5XFY0_9BACT|nr:DNA methyltransferase [Sodaliphilus pleomorphus]MSS18391.1 class I SAM-dependent DNA methyltransferase [Sodaliphilus pleomorphus]
MNTEKQQRQAAIEFAKRWHGRGYEKGESQRYWLDLLGNVYGVPNPTEWVEFEDKVQLDSTSFIDVMIPATHVMIEQKSLGKDLRKPIRQSDGTMLTPFQQAQRYSAALPYSQRPRWIVTCNFAEIDVYDMENPNSEPQHIALINLGDDYYRLQFLVDTGSVHINKEMEVSMQAGEIVGRIYDALIKEYDLTDPRSMRYLNILCVRLVFCLYAEDAGIFGRHDMFHDYLDRYEAADMRDALLRVFDTLNTPVERRSKYLRPDLAAFPYTNGGLFAEQIDVPPFTEEMRHVLLQHASLDFDWSQISPTIFGGVFESTLNAVTRRSGGMHYTSIENIHKVIDPLFLDGLKRKLADITDEPVFKRRLKALHEFQDQLASLVFLDPACGSGNFLTETYLSLRRLENQVIKLIYNMEPLDAFVNPIKVSINQFYGIEINDFAVTVATTALWISESQMMAETESIIHHDIDFLPLHSYANIHEGNALHMDWRHVCPHPDYIIGNPPFVGARLMSPEQKDDMLYVFGKDWKNLGNIDYVGAWYKRSAELMKGTSIQTALVSTNSISQGEQVANLWAPLMRDGLKINFAHCTFRWDSEASLKAHVHVVIVGFSYVDNHNKFIFDNGQTIKAAHINPYLVDAPDTFIHSRSKALCNVPAIGIGNQPIDGGNYLFKKEEMDEFIKKEPKSASYFHLWYGSEEFIHQKPRYCLWLGDCSPKEINEMPLCKKRVENVRLLRLASKRAGTRRLADRPTRFLVENMPNGDSIIIPSVSSEKRRYVPMGFIHKGTFASNLVLLIPSATLYHFGILESNVHMAWMRVVCGRLEMRYRYSKDVVYNNFPWPSPTAEQAEKIATTAQGILDARSHYPDSSLADLYNPNLMPYDLLEAHRANDRAVMAAYGFATRMTETECVSRLFDLYSAMAHMG